MIIFRTPISEIHISDFGARESMLRQLRDFGLRVAGINTPKSDNYVISDFGSRESILRSPTIA